MLDDEALRELSLSSKMLMLRKLFTHFREEPFISAIEHLFFIDQLEHRGCLLVLYQINTELIVNVVDVLPRDLLLFVFILLHRKHVRVELMLQLLICVVDAELLK
jgi:hypothetical protein